MQTGVEFEIEPISGREAAQKNFFLSLNERFSIIERGYVLTPSSMPDRQAPIVKVLPTEKQTKESSEIFMRNQLEETARYEARQEKINSGENNKENRQGVFLAFSIEEVMTVLEVVLSVILAIALLLLILLSFLLRAALKSRNGERQNSRKNSTTELVSATSPVPQNDNRSDREEYQKKKLNENVEAGHVKRSKEPGNFTAKRSKETNKDHAPRSELDNNTGPPPIERSLRQILSEPVSRHEFEKYMTSVVKFVNDYFDDSHTHSVIPDTDVKTKSDLCRKMNTQFSNKPASCEKIIEDVKKIILPNVNFFCLSRGFRTFLSLQREVKSLADILANTIASALGCDLKSSVLFEGLESILCAWLSSAFGLPSQYTPINKPNIIEEKFVGFTFYTTMDVYLSLIQHSRHVADKTNSHSAREVRLSMDYVVYCGEDAQLPLEEACRLARVKLRRVRKSPLSKVEGLTGAEVAKQIEKDRSRKLHPLLIVATYGSANIGATDSLSELISLAEKYRIKIHLDATYAGCQWVEPQYRNAIHSSLASVHSFHVSLFTLFPYSGRLTIMWAIDGFSFETMSQNDNAHQMSENVLRLWLLLRFYGLDSLRATVRKKVNLGKYFSDRLEVHEKIFKVLYHNDHGIVLFQYIKKHEETMNEDVNTMTSKFFNYVNSTSQMKLTLLKYHELVLIRGCVNYERSNASMVDESVSTILNLAEEFEEKLKKRPLECLSSPTWYLTPLIGGSPNETTDKTQPSNL
ncbi:unnamed protein product [Caenorhabditis auriculariae]|uniref:Uncharacterized protein n=1 Tax=Caenorhabditis auriculariae TaxID=2777116 RepID=A0A8S1H4A7_9PELO|nr:unnamed protein product [Caenorhabditis auriculariae]